MNDDLASKQNLLQEEIINKNYDTQKFLNFCISKKENGDDLNSWDMEELKSIIQEFTMEEEEKKAQSKPVVFSLNAFLTSQTQNQPQMQNYPSGQAYVPNTYSTPYNQMNPGMQNVPTQQPELKAITSVPNSAEKVQQTINNTIQSQKLETHENKTYKYEITCKRLEKTVLNDKVVKVIIQNPKASEKSLLTGSYITYEIITECQGWNVRRRYSDFEWLRNVLIKCFPRLLVPPLPGKKYGNRRFEQDFIEKRMKFLQMFLDELMTSESFKSFDGVMAFLCFSDRNQFEAKMKELNGFTPSQYCEDVKTPTGKLMVVDDDDNEKYYTNINNYFKLQATIINRLTESLKAFYGHIQNAANSLEDVAKHLDVLDTLNIKVMMKKEVTKTYEELNIFFKNWKRILCNQNQIIYDKIKDFFKYQKLENIAYLELVESREAIRARYVDERNRLNKKKEKLYVIPDVSKWEIIEDFNNICDRNLLMRDKSYAFSKMCTRETQALENIHKQLGYANYMNVEELKKIIDNNCKKFVENTKGFAEIFYPSLTDGITVWSTLNSYI